MGYYRGDYYRGDYYQGFPLIGAALKLGAGLVKKVAPKIVGKVGGAIGKVVGGIGGIAKKAPVTTGVVTTVGGTMIAEKLSRGGGSGRSYRRMNVANPKALRRAIRRAHGFAKLARKVLTFPISRPPKGRPLFKAARRRR